MKRTNSHRRNCRFCRGRQESISDHQLYRDKEKGKIAGVCAGIAEYTGLQTWLVRILAVTALLFMPQIVILAYIIAIFVIPTKSALQRSREEALDDSLSAQREKQQRFDHAMEQDSSQLSLNAKRRIVRRFKERFSRLEARLQSLESHVTSSQYELNKAFKDI